MHNLIGRCPDKFVAEHSRCVILLRAPWCGRPCESLVPILKEIEAEHPHVAFGFADISGCEDFVARHEVTALPTALGYVDGVLKAISVTTRDKATVIKNLKSVLDHA